MPTLKTSKFPPPKSPFAFEALCRDLFRAIWNDPGAQLHGRNGQRQQGVDIFGRPDGGSAFFGVQCKSGSLVTAAELQDEVAKAKAFEPPLTRFVLATTAPNDATLQKVARQLTSQHFLDGLFSVEVWGWDVLESRLAEHPAVIRHHYPQYAVPDDIAGLRQLAAAQIRWSAEKDRPTFERTSGALTSLAPRFEPSWRIRRASGDYVAAIDWRFCGPRFQMEWQHVDGSQIEHANITATFDLTLESLNAPSRVSIDELGLEIRFWWRDRWRHEIHRWPMRRRELTHKVLWDLGDEVAPTLRFDAD